jgi:DNA-binding protein HU-beta
MNKAELINVIADRVGVTKKQAEDMVESFVDIVTSQLVDDGDVTIAGFGQFTARTRAGRTGVNPQNPTEHIQIPPVRVAKFKPGKGLKDALKAPKNQAPAMEAPEAPAPTPEPEAPAQPETPSYPSM